MFEIQNLMDPCFGMEKSGSALMRRVGRWIGANKGEALGLAGGAGIGALIAAGMQGDTAKDLFTQKSDVFGAVPKWAMLLNPALMPLEATMGLINRQKEKATKPTMLGPAGYHPSVNKQ